MNPIEEKLKIIVVFDTNIFRGEWWLGNDVHWAEYKRCAEFLEIKTVLPEAVFLEITDRAVSLYTSKIGHIRKAINQIKEHSIELQSNFRIGPTENLKALITACEKLEEEEPPLDDALETISGSLSELLGSYQRVKTEVSHGVLLERLFKRLKPFKEKDKDKGYRDALIWYSILDLALTNPAANLVFISENKKDFSNPDDENSLDDSFLNDLELNGISKERLIYRRTLQEFNSKYFDSTLTNAEDWLGEFESEQSESFEEFFCNQHSRIQSTLTDVVEKIFDFSHFHGYDYSDIEFSYLGDLQNLKVDSVKRFDANTVLIVVTFDVEFALTFNSEKYPAYTLENDYFSVLMTLNDHYVALESAGELRVEMRMLLNSEKNQIEKISLDKAVELSA